MRIRTPVKIIGVSSIIVIFFCFLNKKDEIIINQSDGELIEDFDLILTKGQSVESKLINLLNLSIKQDYTHIGLVHKEKDKIYILHATPDGTKENCIRYDEFQTFIDLSAVCDYRIMRDKNMTNGVRQLLNIELEKYKNSKIPFDFEFDNQEHSHIYCSELVYLMFTKVGLFGTKSFDLKKPIDPNVFLYQKELISITERESTTNKYIAAGQ
jgi:hypothetical protein